jgi:hypothetical protein
LEIQQKYFIALGIIILVALIVIMVVPTWVFQSGIDNAFTFINGLTTSTSIVVTFGGAINALMFRELTEKDSKFKRKYFESLGLFLIPLLEAYGAYVFLAIGKPDFALKFSLTAFLTAFLVILSFFLLISRKLDASNSLQAIQQPLPATPETQNVAPNTLNESNKNEPKKRKSQSKNTKLIKWLGYYGSIVAVLLFIVFVAITIISTFPDYVPISNADNLLQIWITTNGVLMGFIGIIFAQLISSTMDQQNTVYQRILEEELKNKHHLEQLKKRLNFLDYRRIALSICTASTLILLAYSILLSMQGLAKNSLLKPTDTYAVNGFMFGPLLYSVLGIGLLIITLVLPSKPPIEESSND